MWYRTVALVVVAIAFLAPCRPVDGQAATPLAVRRVKRPLHPPDATPSPSPKRAGGVDRSPVLAPGAQVRVEVRYPHCPRDPQGASGTGPVPAGLVGLDRSAAAQVLRGYQITEFTGDLLVLVRDVGGCRTAVYTLQDRAGFVVVRQGPPGDAGPIRQSTDIPVRSLGPAARRGLESGIAVPATDLQRTLNTLRQQAQGAMPAES